jgi:hypothetical protein
MAVIETDPIGDLLRTMEEKHDLLKYQVDGWCIWHYFRPAIGTDLLFKNEPLPQKQEVPVFERIWLAVRGLPGLLFPGRASYFVITCSSDRSEVENSKRKNIIFDNLLRELDSFFIVEAVNNRNFIFPAKDVLIESNLTSESLLLLAFVLAKLYTPPSIRKLAIELSQIIRNEFELSQYTPKLVADWCMYFYWLKKIYARLMRRVHPKLVLVGSGGGSYIFAAARELGLKTIEFQHGVVNRFNYVYSWSEYAVAYKKQMPIPNHFFLWSDYGKNELLTFGFWDQNELVPVGSPRIDEYRNKRKNLRSSGFQKCTIVITTGTTAQMTVDFLSKFLQMTRGKLDFELIIKTHPSYETDGSLYLQSFGDDKRVRVVLGNELPSTFDLLVNADMHLSVCSSCHYDSISLGTPTVILGLPCHETFLPLYKEGRALLANTPEELVEIISRFDAYNVPDEVMEAYFKMNALDNIKSELKRIIEEGDDTGG